MGLSGQLHMQVSLTPENFFFPFLQEIKWAAEDFSNFWRGEYFFIQLPGFQLLTFQPTIYG